MLTHPCRLQSRASPSCFASVQPFVYFVSLANVSRGYESFSSLLLRFYRSFSSHSSILLISPLAQSSLTDRFDRLLSSSYTSCRFTRMQFKAVWIYARLSRQPHWHKKSIRFLLSRTRRNVYFIVRSFRKRVYMLPPNLHFRNRARLHSHCQ